MCGHFNYCTNSHLEFTRKNWQFGNLAERMLVSENWSYIRRVTIMFCSVVYNCINKITPQLSHFLWINWSPKFNHRVSNYCLIVFDNVFLHLIFALNIMNLTNKAFIMFFLNSILWGCLQYKHLSTRAILKPKYIVLFIVSFILSSKPLFFQYNYQVLN